MSEAGNIVKDHRVRFTLIRTSSFAADLEARVWSMVKSCRTVARTVLTGLIRSAFKSTVIRYPAALKNSSQIDDQITRELLGGA